MRTVKSTVIVVKAKSEKGITPPQMSRNIVKKYPAPHAVPVDDLDDEQEIGEFLYTNWGEGYYRVFAPGHAQQMKTYFKGYIEPSRWPW